MVNAESQPITLSSYYPQRYGGKALGRERAQKICVGRFVLFISRTNHSVFRNEDKGDSKMKALFFL